MSDIHLEIVFQNVVRVISQILVFITFECKVKFVFNCSLYVCRSIYKISLLWVRFYSDRTQFLVYGYLHEILRTFFFGSDLWCYLSILLSYNLF
jgi:hypothetical protein